ncbi:hypothetical protein NDU88_007415 [Pleurodeles waltl]|uniref:Uncharacterized protein n=1 Tax=Pleurodeles waltl TaxID=8319 RepID=A0AAV7VSA2_PLEWA|nr:hypothetical protein NDU88_007415 [Pleurodeles waltl]
MEGGWLGSDPRRGGRGADGNGPRSAGPQNKNAQSGPQEPEGGYETGPAPSERDEALLTRAFMEQLFGFLSEDFAMLKRDIPADIKDLKKEVIDLGQRVDSVEQTQDAREEELDCHSRELLTLQDKNQDL